MSTRRLLIRTGFDFESPPLTFYVAGEPEDLSAATIEAVLKSEDKSTELIADTAQVDGSGASWADGVVVIRFPLADTTALTPGRAWIEVAVVLSGIRLPYEDLPVVIEEGHAT